MAVITKKIDDLDNKSEADTYTFAFDGQEYEIDLSPKNRDLMVKTLDLYIHAGREVKAKPGVRKSRTRTKVSAKAEQNVMVRAWARDHGFEVGDRGRIPAPVLEAFEAAHK